MEEMIFNLTNAREGDTKIENYCRLIIENKCLIEAEPHHAQSEDLVGWQQFGKIGSG